MNDPDDNGTSCIRVATDEDIPLLAMHHRLMVEEIQEHTGARPDPAGMTVLEKEYAEKLAREFRTGTCRAWGAQNGDLIVSSGAISIVSYVPVPHDLSSRIAFLHSIYTEKAYRHQQHARAITQEAKNFCRNRGIRLLYLLASDAGRPVYEKSGFVPVPNLMLFLQ